MLITQKMVKNLYTTAGPRPQKNSHWSHKRVLKKGKCQISVQNSTILCIHHIYNNEVSVNITAQSFILNLFLKLPDLSVLVSKHSHNLQLELGTMVARYNNACSKYQQQSVLYTTVAIQHTPKWENIRYTWL